MLPDQPAMTPQEMEHIRKVAEAIPVVEHPPTFPESARLLFDQWLVLSYDEEGAWRVQTEMADGTHAVISVNNRMRGEMARAQIRGIALELLGHFLQAQTRLDNERRNGRDYRIRKLTADEVHDFKVRDRFCCGSRIQSDGDPVKWAEFEASFNVRTSDRKRGAAPGATIVARQKRLMCLDHARKFAEKRGLVKELDALTAGGT
jgi:hypothetical protein